MPYVLGSDNALALSLLARLLEQEKIAEQANIDMVANGSLRNYASIFDVNYVYV